VSASKEENRYTYKPETVKKTGDLEKTNIPVQKDNGNVERSGNRGRTVTKKAPTKNNPATGSRNIKSNGREKNQNGSQVKKRSTERKRETDNKGSSTGKRSARVEKNKKDNGGSFLSRIGSLFSKTKNISQRESSKGKAKARTKTGDRSKQTGNSEKRNQPVKKKTTKRKGVKKKN